LKCWHEFDRGVYYSDVRKCPHCGFTWAESRIYGQFVYVSDHLTWVDVPMGCLLILREEEV